MIREKIFNSNSFQFLLKARLKSFAYAWEGVVYFFKTEVNAQLHLASTVMVVFLSVALRIHKWEAIAVVFSITLVWITEMINTSIEKTMDFISTEKHHPIKIIKDIAAGAVLISAIASFIIGCIVFIPKLLML